MFILEYEDDIIVVDCGVAFPHEEQPGIDLVLPDISYLRQHRDRVRAIFITHGHEDHIGSLPYLLPDINVPIYATKLTLGLIGVKLEERGLKERAELIELNPDTDEVTKIGAFAVEPFRVCHSIPDAVGFAFSTPVGLIVHTGDFKLDETPIDGRKTDFTKIERFRQQGVRLLISDCVHVESRGFTPSERVVGEIVRRDLSYGGWPNHHRDIRVAHCANSASDRYRGEIRSQGRDAGTKYREQRQNGARAWLSQRSESRAHRLQGSGQTPR